MFVSKSQQRYLFAKKPQVAKKFAAKTPKSAYKNLPQVVKFLAARGAKIDVWNKNDKFEWTPLAIAAGYRFGNFKPSPDTEAAIREVMIAAGVTPPKVVIAKTQQIY